MTVYPTPICMPASVAEPVMGLITALMSG